MAALDASMVVVFCVVAAAIVLFVTEWLPPDTTAIAVAVSLVVLQPWTGIGPADALSGFSGTATVTILAMYVLSAGVQDTGVVDRLGTEIGRVTRGDGGRLLGAIVGVTGTLAGFVNNTPVVAVFVPMVRDLAEHSRTSPSKLLIPLSYAAMLGGTLTLVGTATNVVASDLAVQFVETTPGRYPRLADGFQMFEFTALGVLVTLVGGAYLLTVAQRLLPDRIPVVDLIGTYEMDGYLWRVFVPQDSASVDATVDELVADLDLDLDLDVVQIIRGREAIQAPSTDRGIEGGDTLTVRADGDVVREFVSARDMRLLPAASITEAELADPERVGTLVEVVVPSDSPLAGRTVGETRLRERYADTVLAARRGEELIHEGLADLELRPGTGLLIHTTRDSVAAIRESGDLTIVQEVQVVGEDEKPEPLGRDVAIAVGILVGVVGVAAVDLLPIAISALGGVVAMVVTGVVDASDAYDAVAWDVVILLAGILPLGLAMQETEGAVFLADLVVGTADVLPPIAVLALFYLLTGLLANVITPVASVVLVFPVAVQSAVEIGADPFAFALAVTFAGSTAFMTPIGYQTNLMVYSPGGYRFIDYVRVGAPLQLLLTVVTPVGIALLYGL